MLRNLVSKYTGGSPTVSQEAKITTENDYRSFDRIEVGKVPFECVSMNDAVRVTIEAATKGGVLPVRLSNAYCVALAEGDDDYRGLLNGPGLNFPDGMPVVWAMRLLSANSVKSPGRVRGPSFFREVVDKGRPYRLRHFLLGTTPETLTKLERSLKEDFPGLLVSGSYAPPFAPVDDDFMEACRAAVLESGGDIVWVGLGTPKQDYVALRLSQMLELPCLGVGAAFDFSAGSSREAPEWAQRSGFEWAYRLMSDPKRLWKRYLFGNATFVRAVLRGVLRSGGTRVLPD
ncbi:WecB/TagA/CpsF family glycosyltransferase [Rhodococcus pyridinivorans]|uniref:WecB/TagA/CpsF family glycosyltransferase n=1 Tax=Rhodococcus pyridinivorans TaxID=103816 RepID=UPI0022833701|nr:WecB/TagA/CpsF family glycosyltransferase [Rhodococcus pyridinivorans]WAL45699.1 WecB/TagA/CpsF family glycosyltransferase [Rhodococcus pyridinivorans]